MGKRLTYCFFLFISVFFVAELLFRLLVFVKTPDGLLFNHDLVYSFAPHSIVYNQKLNNIGALGNDALPWVTQEGPLRVFLFGGSTSFSKHYMDSVEKYLQVYFDTPCTVISFGKPRYTSHQAKILAEQTFAQYQPDVAVLYLGINDTIYDTFSWLESIPNVGYLNWKSAWPPLLFQGIEYHVVQKRIRSTPSFPEGELRSEKILRDNVETIIDLAKAHNVQLVLSEFALGHPGKDPKLDSIIQEQEPIMRHFWGNLDSTVRAIKAHNGVLTQLASEYQLEYAPVGKMLPKTGEYFRDICHLTTSGNGILGKTIAKAVIQSIEKNNSPAGNLTTDLTGKP